MVCRRSICSGAKCIRDGGATANEFIASMRADVNGVAGEYRDALELAIDRLADVTKRLLERASSDPALAGAASVDYLDLFALTTYAWLWARMATIAPSDEFGAAKRHTAKFFYARLLPRSLALTAGDRQSIRPRSWTCPPHHSDSTGTSVASASAGGGIYSRARVTRIGIVARFDRAQIQRPFRHHFRRHRHRVFAPIGSTRFARVMTKKWCRRVIVFTSVS